MRLRIAFPVGVLLGFLAACGSSTPRDVEAQELGQSSQALSDLGEFCSGQWDCYSGMVCNGNRCLVPCSSDAECRFVANPESNFRACRNGACQPTPKNPGPIPCEPACWGGEVCIHGSCQVPVEEECTPGWDCETADP